MHSLGGWYDDSVQGDLILPFWALLPCVSIADIVKGSDDGKATDI